MRRVDGWLIVALVLSAIASTALGHCGGYEACTDLMEDRR
jgi:hypothetical protein